MKRVIIIDDEIDARQAIRTLLETYCPDVIICEEAHSVESAFISINQYNPHCILLDISMEDGNGFELLDRFPNPEFHVIFITAHDDYALRAFKYCALDYLLKPIQVEELIRAVKRIKTESLSDYIPKIKNLLESNKKRRFDKITLTSMEGLVFVTIADIIQLESSGSYTTFYLVNKEKHLVAKPMKEFEDLLPEDSFFKIHQSHIVNINFVKKILREDGGIVIMSDGLKLPVARRRKDEFLMTMQNNLSKESD